MTIEKIEKSILNFKDLKLNHVVTLGGVGRNGQRKNNIYLSTYNSNKYTDQKSLSTLYLNSSDYLVFKHSKTKEEVYFSYPHLVDLVSKLKKMDKLLKKKSDEIFIEREGQSLINVDYKGKIKIYGASNSIIYIGFSIFKDNDDEYFGVSMFLNKVDNLINLTTDELSTLIHIIERFDLYASSILLLNASNIILGGAVEENNISTNKSSKSSGKVYKKRGE